MLHESGASVGTGVPAIQISDGAPEILTRAGLVLLSVVLLRQCAHEPCRCLLYTTIQYRYFCMIA
uniref:Uncharacterized protein n=1 Tax=Arundo donax TaxID=35708 RepID=A0A0A9CEZ7_ARUDO